MIRLAVERDFERPISTECELRICGLRRAYGLSATFLRFYADEHGSLASIMDGFCVLECEKSAIDEWLCFLHMNPDIAVIHTTAEIGEIFARKYGRPMTSGTVLMIDNMTSDLTLHVEVPSIRNVYQLLSSVFPSFSSFDGWYVDVSHRVRHDCCHISAIEKGGNIVCVAMTVAETEHAALIGGVATLPQYRAKGYASQCIQKLLSSLPHQTVYIASSDHSTDDLYQRLGFSVQGEWSEISLV